MIIFHETAGFTHTRPMYFFQDSAIPSYKASCVCRPG